MHALPVVIGSGGEHKLFDGTLVSLPIELRSPYQMTVYTKMAPKGWSQCPQGYWVFVAIDSDGNRYVVPGLTIAGERRSKKKFFERTHEFSKDRVEAFCKSLISERDRINAAKDEELGDLIHDLRALSSAIYNSAEAAKTACADRNLSVAEDRIETVIATHFMLSIRIDLIDYLSNRVALENHTTIPVFKKVDKVVRCFRPKASARSINLVLRGNSFGSVRGPQIFELVPYAIVDNAIKYAPSNSDVVVGVAENSESFEISVRSIGPRIDPDEVRKIFDKGYRGRHVQNSGRQGTGIGLSTAGSLLEEHFGGTISVTQDEVEHPLHDSMHWTSFEITLPRD
ncbi:MAG: HAMP domain-containing histidine kinase [Alphaproteobacteria bacterium]|nr:HAMP domain-containing histidine kinase [Alphaproteobacteria bacterium]